MATICVQRKPRKVNPFIGLPDHLWLDDDWADFIWCARDEPAREIDAFGDKLTVRAR